MKLNLKLFSLLLILVIVSSSEEKGTVDIDDQNVLRIEKGPALETSTNGLDLNDGKKWIIKESIWNSMFKINQLANGMGTDNYPELGLSIAHYTNEISANIDLSNENDAAFNLLFQAILNEVSNLQNDISEGMWIIKELCDKFYAYFHIINEEPIVYGEYSGWIKKDLYIIPFGVEMEEPIAPKRVENPHNVKLEFLGFDFGDYPHFSFQTEDEEYFDFADGENNLGVLDYLETEDERSMQAIGNWYIVSLDSLWSIYNCCEGEYDLHYSFKPSIVDIKEL